MNAHNEMGMGPKCWGEMVRAAFFWSELIIIKGLVWGWSFMVWGDIKQIPSFTLTCR